MYDSTERLPLEVKFWKPQVRRSTNKRYLLNLYMFAEFQRYLTHGFGVRGYGGLYTNESNEFSDKYRWYSIDFLFIKAL